MKCIIITSPESCLGEVTSICHLIDRGADAIHLRKPSYTYTQYATILKQIPESYHSHIMIHDHFRLCEEFDLKGIHLNSRNPEVPNGYKGKISCSCHTVEEVIKHKQEVSYLFLSPIFDSISKQGYKSVFSLNKLESLSKDGIIDEKVVALGGVTLEHIPQLKELSFGGAAFLGDIWQRFQKQSIEEIDKYMDSIILLLA